MNIRVVIAICQLQDILDDMQSMNGENISVAAKQAVVGYGHVDINARYSGEKGS